MSELKVLIADQVAGTLTENANGALSFAYDSRYAGVPLSLSMPVSNRVFSDKVVRPFLFGVLPDSREVRRSLGREFGVSGNNPFALLSHIGLDCPGAIQFCSEEDLKSIDQNEELRPISNEEIAERLRRGRLDLNASWESKEEHWSLGGQQSKFALREEKGQWYRCEGAAATTHIFKPGIPGLQLQALNEFICLRTAKECGLPAVDVSYEAFCDEPAIIISRFDRFRLSSGRILRLHQEDFCQALGVLPEKKYVEDGGPSANEAIALCKNTGVVSQANVASFIDMLFFNYLIGAPDAHAKNYSLLLDKEVAYLAPLYDVASILPYTERSFEARVAMGVMGENRLGHISKHRLERFVEFNDLEAYGLNVDVLVERLATLAQSVPRALNDVFEKESAISRIDELRERFLPKVIEVCERALARIAK